MWEVRIHITHTFRSHSYDDDVIEILHYITSVFLVNVINERRDGFTLRRRVACVSVIYYQLIIYNRLHQNAWPTPGPEIFVNISDGSRLHRENFKSNNE